MENVNYPTAITKRKTIMPSDCFGADYVFSAPVGGILDKHANWHSAKIVSAVTDGLCATDIHNLPICKRKISNGKVWVYLTINDVELAEKQIREMFDWITDIMTRFSMFRRFMNAYEEVKNLAIK